jgi:SAM-dependent methyltransferase
MDLGFRGDVADYYHVYRHGYPPAVIDGLTSAFGLTPSDVVVDLGCGTGQLTLPLARRVRAVVGVDPEPDMLQRARQAARDAAVTNVAWVIGSDGDLPALRTLLHDYSVGALVIGQALHWMRAADVFRDAVPLLRLGGGVAVLANGTPQWQQDSDWSRALRGFLERWLSTELTAACGTDEQSQHRYAALLAAAGFDVRSASVDYDVSLDLDQIVGGVFSALGADLLPPPGERAAFAEQLRAALPAIDRFPEHVRVAVLTARLQ